MIKRKIIEVKIKLTPLYIYIGIRSHRYKQKYLTLKVLKFQ